MIDIDVARAMIGLWFALARNDPARWPLDDAWSWCATLLACGIDVLDLALAPENRYRGASSFT